MLKGVILSEIDSRNGPIKLVYFVTPCSNRDIYTEGGGALGFPRGGTFFHTALFLLSDVEYLVYMVLLIKLESRENLHSVEIKLYSIITAYWVPILDTV